MRPDELAALVVRDVVEKSGLDPMLVDDVIVGAAIQVGEQGLNLGRMVGALAGLPPSVPGATVSRGCASSLDALRIAANAIRAGEGSIYVVAGVESMSRVMSRAFNPDDANPRFTDRSRDDFAGDLYIPMGITAEIVAERFSITRERMDEFALRSHQRASQAATEGVHRDDLVPVQLGDGTLFEVDECIRPNTTLDALAALAPAFKEGGRVTAGNSCPQNDGAAALVLMSEDAAKTLGVQPLARVLGSTVTGIEPEIMGVGPIAACRRLFDQLKCKVYDVNVFELNEAFASQVLAVCDELEIDIEGQLNPHGGAIALGHPFGMTGVRLVSALCNDLRRRDQSLGVATLCVGQGQGMALAVERI